MFSKLLKNGAFGYHAVLRSFFKCSHIISICSAFQNPRALPENQILVFQQLAGILHNCQGGSR
jgi:hypothetical protein